MISSLQTLFDEVVLKDTLLGGKAVISFEKDFASYQGRSHAISCANGTDALEIALRGLGIGAGDEVIVPANGWMSAAEAVCLLHAQPVFVDNHPDAYTLDPKRIEEKITSRTKAIIPIHLYGLPADMPEICALAQKHQLKVIEDCAQAHGASIGGKKVGNWGDIAAFSFYPTKNLGAIGDAGAMVTADSSLAEMCRQIASHGQITRNQHIRLGRNSRMDTLQAAVLQYKLGFLEDWNARRRALAARYTDALKVLPIQLPVEKADDYHIYHLYVIQSERRDWLMDALGKLGVGTAIHYPQAVADMPVFSQYRQDDTPVASKQARQLLSLPLYPELEDDEQGYVIECMHKLLR
ncbi:DegT/DnrJ/EryC1/StrS family aminotransferase [Catalinimonas niigatensis]|uniref:DegT/DnrJ/EryC1/StrS family aminotransferase n=1 Tax=Catalinimonas niigatensis TaxID=1397264 RepID=UPI0026651E70|nr:DegT/DnrJ/EryC1/StrS family aminotransferase [Catalinimonas niigatensis]WPP51663.1 DegT/DnrJ/EryC1/StrS family aminotransferase [Catalinimonas niigatensis]